MEEEFSFVIEKLETALDHYYILQKHRCRNCTDFKTPTFSEPGWCNRYNEKTCETDFCSKGTIKKEGLEW